MILEGTIEDIIFRNESNGYTVALISHGEVLDTCVGKFIEINAGQYVKLTGNYVKNAKYGDQFSFDIAEITEPNSCDGIEKYLSSGLLPGVGPVTAHNIVREFGKSTLEIIEFQPEQLAKVKGVSKQKANTIYSNYIQTKKIQKVIMFLQKYDFTINTALKIYEVYGDKTTKIVEENPYQLVEDIDGIGFHTADNLAHKMGIKKDSEFRIRAGILYTLISNTEKDGNTYIPKVLAFKLLIKLLEQPEEDIKDVFEKVLETLCLEKLILTFWKDNIEMIMLQKMYNTEKFLAKKISTLAYMNENHNINIDSEIKNFEQINKINFHQEQKNAISLAFNNGVSIITGGPGTGKTTIIKCLINILKQNKKKVLLLAPTGRATKRLSESTGEEAKTIHRALEVEHVKNSIRFKYNERNTLQTDCIICDEVSMIDNMLASSLLKAMPQNCQLILVGDKDQLPSVGAGNLLGELLKSDIIKVAYLTKIFRQDNDSIIVLNAHKINNGEMPILDNRSNDFFYEDKNDLEDIKNTVIALATKRIPKYLNCEVNKIQVLTALKAGICGTNNLNNVLQEYINPSSSIKAEVICGDIVFRFGDRVMQTANNYNLEWTRDNGKTIEKGLGVFNGDIGYITNINLQVGEIIVSFDDGRICKYSRLDLSQLSLSYAMTIHKSQGCEFDVVIMPIVSGASIILTKNLFYTAVTRAKKMVVLVGDKFNMGKMVKNKYTEKRYSMLSCYLQEEFNHLGEIYG